MISACRMMNWLFWICLLEMVILSTALTGYNCGLGKPNVTVISLVDVGNCDLEQLQPSAKPVFFQLLQKVEHESIFVRRCKILGHQRIRKCGMFSHNSDVSEGDSTFVKKLSADECGDLATFGQFKYGQAIIAGVQINQTTRQPATIVGIVHDDGVCQGSTYVSNGHEYTDVVVTVNFEITVQEFSATLKRSSNEVLLPSGTKCRYSNGHCFENGESYAFWQIIPTPPCNFQGYETLFQGIGMKVSENSTSNPEIYFANSTGNIQFGLAKTGEFTLCGYRIFSTEHPKLFIMETSPDFLLPAKQRIDVQDILLTAYFNTKLTYFARHVKNQITNVYKDIVLHRCQLERQVILNSLSLISTSPDEFALNIMKKPSFTAIASGEAAHILQCQPQICKLRSSLNCYAEIPVSCDNISMFLRPKTRILTSIGTPRDCNNMLPTFFKINNSWHSTPAAQQHQEPIVLQPMKSFTWKYQNLDGLISDGIYSPDDLERLHDHAVFPMEKPALIENIVRKLSGKPEHIDAISMKNLMDENLIISIAESSLAKAWSGFLKFGAAAAGFIAVFIILQFLKACMDMIIHGYTLYKIYGWSVRLLGAVFSSITHLLLYLGTAPSQKNEVDIEQGQFLATSTEDINSSPRRSDDKYKTFRVADRFSANASRPLNRQNDHMRAEFLVETLRGKSKTSSESKQTE